MVVVRTISLNCVHRSDSDETKASEISARRRLLVAQPPLLILLLLLLLLLFLLLFFAAEVRMS